MGQAWEEVRHRARGGRVILMSDHVIVKMDEWSVIIVFAMPIVSLLYDYAFMPLMERYRQTRLESGEEAPAPGDTPAFAESSVRFALAPGKRVRAPRSPCPDV